ncbi:MAG TPA: choice-of-anchor tandem repeat GloVer-containing protein [Candidatus Binatia bacterium]|nr:choice-of-anchor tandem repeat GloVer-containing protein [Candidatus Binatia bacterium]
MGSALTQGSDGYLYGVALQGGADDLGTIFKISTSGQIVFCRSFTGKENGANPFGPLIEASDGLFYGMTNSGGVQGYGTAFKMDRDGHITTFFHFKPPTSVYPLGGFVQGTDGYLYGALTEHTLPNLGSLFRLTLSGQYEQLYNFTATVGEYVGTSLMQHTNGAFYGSAEYGGAFGFGAIYTLDMHLPPFITFVRRNGKVGKSAQILGQGLKGASAVTFNGIPATSFSVETDTFMTAVVPSGATTGPVVVTTATGAIASNVNFQGLK